MSRAKNAGCTLLLYLVIGLAVLVWLLEANSDLVGVAALAYVGIFLLLASYCVVALLRGLWRDRNSDEEPQIISPTTRDESVAVRTGPGATQAQTAPAAAAETLVDKIIRTSKNRPIIAFVMILATLIIVTGQVARAIEDIGRLVQKVTTSEPADSQPKNQG